MQVITLGMLEAKEGQSESLMDVIKEYMIFIEKQPGLIHSYVARAKDNSNKLLATSVWENEEAQQAAIAKLSSDPGAAAGFFAMMQLLNGQPDFGNYIVESITK